MDALNQPGFLLGVVGAIVGAVPLGLSAWAAIIKARAPFNAALALLKRLRDWLESQDLVKRMPRGLRAEFERIIDEPLHDSEDTEEVQT